MQGGSEFAGLAVVASFVIEGDGEVLGMADGQCVSLLEEDEAEIVLVLLEEYHGDEIAELAHLNRNSFVFLALTADVIFIELQDLLVLVQGLPVLGLPLQLLTLQL